MKLVIGDGTSDFCVAGKADFVFAKGKLVEHCRREGIPHQPIAGFADAVRMLPTLQAASQVRPSPLLRCRA